jgi:two-component system, chemotaxis family, sensor kinase Cph1
VNKDARTPVDISECEREPIHVPGHCQPFGVLLAMQTGHERICQISKNTELVFGVEAGEVVGCKLSNVFGNSDASKILDIFESGNWKEINPLRLLVTHGGKGLAVDVILHRYDGLDFVEVEPVSAESAERASRSFHLLHDALTRLQTSRNSGELWEATVTEVQRITGYDRVMVYKFDRDDHGSVVAEQKQGHQESFLGLHYPASDIPEQARRLYRINWIRYIPDVYYKPVAVIPVVDEDHRRPTDMTYCVLRSVSPVHCEYLHNMGVGASMSVSIVRDNRLWGLIACHHATPRHLPYKLRLACEQLAQVVSLRIAALEEQENSAGTNLLQAQMLAELPNASDIVTALVPETFNLLEYIEATGAAVCYGENTLTLGRTPNESQIRMILEFTLRRVSAPIFATDRLQDRLLEAEKFTDTASGVLCFTASRDRDFHILWFRTEQVREVRWAGEPDKPAAFDGSRLRLGPRRSFEVWKQEVRGQSQAWRPAEIEAAAELRSTLISMISAKGEGKPAVPENLIQGLPKLPSRIL